MQPATTWERLQALDERASRKMWVAESPGLLRTAAILFAHSGDSWLWGLLLGLTWFFSTDPWKVWAAWMLVGVLATAVLVFAIKFTVRRRRPEGEWGQFYRRTDPHSFPSGHAARAAMLAMMSLLFGPAWLGWVLLVWAPLVMLARVAMGLHFLSDVLAGALLGVGISALLWWAIPRLLALL